MGLFARTRNGIARASWETRVAVGAPILVAAFTVPVVFGAFSEAQEGKVGGGSYGPPVTTVAAVPTTKAPAAPVATAKVNPSFTG
jgi:hypothetical protein